MQGTQRAAAPSRTAARKGACMAAPDSDQQVADRDRPRRAARARGRSDADGRPAAAGLRGGRGHAGGARRVARALALGGVAVRPGLSEAPGGRGWSWRCARRRGVAWWPWACGARLVLAGAGRASAQLAAATQTRHRGPGADRREGPAARGDRAAATTETTETTRRALRGRAPAGPSRAPRQGRTRRRRRARAPVTVRSRRRRHVLCVEDGTGRRLFDGNLAGTGPSGPASCG